MQLLLTYLARSQDPDTMAECHNVKEATYCKPVLLINDPGTIGTKQ